MFLFVYYNYNKQGGLTHNEKSILDMFLSLLSFYLIFIFTNFFQSRALTVIFKRPKNIQEMALL